MKNKLPSEISEDKERLIARQVEPVGEKENKKIKKSFLRTIGEFLGFVKKYTASDIDRLKEAGVALVEAKTAAKEAEAFEKIAKAAELHASAELKKAQSAATKLDAEGNLLVKRAEAMERAANAFSKIKQNGGDIAFDSEQLKRFLELGDGEE